MKTTCSQVAWAVLIVSCVWCASVCQAQQGVSGHPGDGTEPRGAAYRLQDEPVQSGLDSGEPSRLSRRLINLTWKEFEQEIVSLWGNQLEATSENGDSSVIRVLLPGNTRIPNQMVIDRNRNLLTFEGSRENARTWSEMVELIDVQATRGPTTVQLVGMGQIEPAIVRNTVLLLGVGEAGPGSLRSATGRMPGGGALSAAPAGNPLVPAGPLTTLHRQQDDQPSVGQQDPPVIAELDDDTLQGNVKIKILDEFGTIVLIGAPEDTARVRAIIESLVRAADVAQPGVELIPLENADSTTVKPIIDEVYESMYQTQSGGINVTALQTPNALLVIGRPNGLEIVRELVKQLDIATPASADGTLDFKVFRLKHMSSMDAALKLRAFFYTGEQENETVDPQEWIASLHGPVAIIMDYRINSVIVKGNAEVLRRAEALLAQLDVVDLETKSVVRVFPVYNTLATDLALVLQNAINGGLNGAPQAFAPGAEQFGAQQQTFQQQGALARARSTMLEIISIDGEGRVASGVLFDVQVTANASSNQLIVTGPEESMDLVAELIRQMDQVPDAETQIKVYQILYGDATTLLTMLETLFGTNPGGGGGFAQGQNNLGNLPLQSASATTSASLLNLRFSVEPRTNSIIASGSAGDLQVIEDLLYRLDEQDVSDRINETYRLKNASAEDVAVAINEWLDSRQEVIELDPTSANPYTTARSQVIVVPEIVTNSLIVSATPRYYSEVMRLIEQFDYQPPMVKIKVLLAEVRLDEVSEFGVEWGIQDSLVFDRGVGDPSNIGFPFNQDGLGNNSDALALSTREALAGQALSLLNFGRTNQTLGFGGLVLTAGNESIDVLIRALEQRGAIRVLSTPSITTVENLQGRVQVGQNVARVRGATPSQNGFSTFVTLNVEDVPTGVILEITPRVSPDGMIIMTVDAINSKLGDESEGTPVFIDDDQIVRSPPINIIQAQTTIMARSGQTVAFSGLIQDTIAKEMRGTPILSDLPGLGPLFTFETDVHRRDELLIIMTPYIVDPNNEEVVSALNQSDMDRLHWCLADVADVFGPVGYGGYETEIIETGVPATYFPDDDPAAVNPQYLPLDSGPQQLPPGAAEAFENPAGPEGGPVPGSPDAPALPDGFSRLDAPMPADPDIRSTRIPDVVRNPAFESWQKATPEAVVAPRLQVPVVSRADFPGTCPPVSGELLVPAIPPTDHLAGPPRQAAVDHRGSLLPRQSRHRLGDLPREARTIPATESTPINDPYYR